MTATTKPSIQPKETAATAPATRAMLTAQPTGVSALSQRASHTKAGTASRRARALRTQP